MIRRLAIIGGGAAAATLLSELATRRPGPAVRIDWYTGGGRGRGIAYSTPSPRHLLNVRAASMGLFTGKPQGFLDYARQHDPKVAGTDFLPRRFYGDYLESEVAQALEQARDSGTEVNVVPFAVDALVPEAGGITVVQGEDHRSVDAAVLAIGTLPAQPLPGVDAQVLASGRYILSPWGFMDQPDTQPPPRDVVLIGLGLTSVDMLLELAARWPQTRFRAISRHGILPAAHLASASAPGDDSGQLIEAMQDTPSARAWLSLLRDAIAHSHDWRTVIDSLRPHTALLWRSLPEEERARFMRHARWAWEGARHRMPPQVAAQIQQLEAEGRLQRLRGSLAHVAVQSNQLAVQLAANRNAPASPLLADLVIQTAGLNIDVARTPHPLISQLRTNGHVDAAALGLGLAAETDGRLRHGEHAWPHLFAIGPMLTGALWESTAMPEIRQQARSLAERLLATTTAGAR